MKTQEGQKQVHAGNAYVCLHEFEENGQLDLGKSRVWLCENDKITFALVN